MRRGRLRRGRLRSRRSRSRRIRSPWGGYAPSAGSNDPRLAKREILGDRPGPEVNVDGLIGVRGLDFEIKPGTPK